MFYCHIRRTIQLTVHTSSNANQSQNELLDNTRLGKHSRSRRRGRGLGIDKLIIFSAPVQLCGGLKCIGFCLSICP